MSEAVETFVVDGHTVALYQDSDCLSPRDSDALLGLFLGLPHRSYNIGDEQLGAHAVYPCPDCGGAGCAGCEGEGERAPRDPADLAAMLKALHGARVVLQVGMIDHSGVSFYVGGGAHPHDPGGWDSGTCGFILDTPQTRKNYFGEVEPTEEQITQGLSVEVEEYARWAQGDCYGYTITDTNGEQVDSCWGYIGYEYAAAEARSAAQGLEQPAALRFSVTLSVEVDRATWAAEYGIEPGQVGADVAEYYAPDILAQAWAEPDPRGGPALLGPLGRLTAVAVAMPGAPPASHTVSAPLAVPLTPPDPLERNHEHGDSEGHPG